MGSCASTGVSRVSSPIRSSLHPPSDHNLLLNPTTRSSIISAKGFDMNHIQGTASPDGEHGKLAELGKGFLIRVWRRVSALGHDYTTVKDMEDIPLKTVDPIIMDAQLDHQCANAGISMNFYKHMASSTLGEFIHIPADMDAFHNYGAPEALRACFTRMRQVYDAVERNRIGKATLLKNLHYAINVLESMYAMEKRRIRDEDDDLSEAATEFVPDEVRDWLASTFTRTQPSVCFGQNKPRFRSVANAIRAGIFVERIYRRMSSCTNLAIPPNVLLFLKTEIDQWSFDSFALNEASENHALKFVAYELFHRYNLINKFQINGTVLESLLVQLEMGYSKYSNPYHNLVHAADVMQTCHMIMHLNDLRKWLSDLDVFALLFAAVIHDYEHTGTTNNFHIQTASQLALLYNDRGVLENHHVSSVFRMTRENEYDIFTGLDKDQFKEFRQMVIEMVLCTDMSLHFQQLKNMKSMLTMPESIDKAKALSLIVHCADIGHPAKKWPLHEQWTYVLCEEFFRQGDREKELELPVSPLCDRNTVVIPQSQIGFIDFIVEPSFQVLGDMIERIISPPPLSREDSVEHESRASSQEKSVEDLVVVPRPWLEHFKENKQTWSTMAAEPKSKT